MTGLFFCLASAEGAGLLFCPFAIHPHTSVYSGFLYHPWLYTANAVKPRTGLCRRFSCDLSHSTAADTRPTQAAIIPPAPRLSVSQRRSTSSTYQIPPPRRTLCRSAQPPYYNKVYRGGSAAYRKPCLRRGLDTSHARRLAIWHRVSSQGVPAYTLHPAGQSSGRGRSGRRGTIGGYRRSSFRASAR